MKKIVSIGIVLPMASFASSQEVLVPSSAPSAAAGSSFIGPYSSSERIYQLLINSSQLAGAVGKQLTSISFRNPTSATTSWPSSPVTFSEFSVSLGNAVSPISRSLTFALNYTSTLHTVRSGPLTVPQNSVPILGSNFAWGSAIPITPTLYTGGHLLVELRHTGFSGSSRSVDAVSTAGPGYGTNFAAIWASSLLATTGSPGSFAALKFTTQDPVVSISGSIAFQDLTVPPTGRAVYVSIHSAGSTVSLYSTNVVVSSTGAYSVATLLNPGNYDLYFNAPPFLLRKKSGVNIPNFFATITGQNVSLQNGDADNSGEVDAADIDAVIAAFGAATGGQGYTILVDVDGSGEVDAADIDIVIANFGGVDD